MNVYRIALLTLTTIMLLGCFDDDTNDNANSDIISEQPEVVTEPEPETPTVTIAKSDSVLQWKRYQGFEQDLVNALELPASELCTGPSGESCTQDLFLVTLGGHDPFEAATYESVDSPLNTTPVATDRVVMSACNQRMEIDDLDNENALFTQLNFNEDMSTHSSENTELFIADLFQRFHQRSPSSTEVDIIMKLNGEDSDTDISTKDFAKMACYAIGTTTEFVFF